jgi:hypothetical protein
MTMLFIAYIFFHPLNHVQCASFYHGLWILINVLSMNPIQPRNSRKCVPKNTLSSTVGHWISLPCALLIHDAMNNASSHNADLDQFHMNVSYLMTLSCFMYKMKLNRSCLGVNLDGLPYIISTSFHFMQDKKEEDLNSLTLTLNVDPKNP